MANSLTGLIDHRGYLRCAPGESDGQEVGGAEDHVGWPGEGWTGPAGEGGRGTRYLSAPAGGYPRVGGGEGGGVCAEGEDDDRLLGLPEEDLYAVVKGRSWMVGRVETTGCMGKGVSFAVVHVERLCQGRVRDDLLRAWGRGLEQ